jgi:hypothetical protein
MRTFVVVLFVAASLLFTTNRPCFAQAANTAQSKEAKAAQKVKKDVEKIGIGKTITVARVDGRTFYGRVGKIERDSFEIVETDSNHTVYFRYIDAKSVWKGDGRLSITGKRNNPRRGWIWGLAVIGALVAVFGIALSDKDF